MTQAAIQSPAAPSVVTPRTTITVPGADGVHHAYSAADPGALRARKAELSNQLNSADARRREVQESLRGAVGANNAMPLAVVFTLFVLSPIALSVSRTIWKRGSRPAAAPTNTDTTHRLERIEQSVEAIAIEIERVSEGQRFVTRIMTDDRQGTLPPGQAAIDPIPLGAESLLERR